MNTFEKFFEYICTKELCKITFYDKSKNKTEYNCDDIKREVLIVSNYIKKYETKLKNEKWIRLISIDNRSTFFVAFALLSLGYNVLLANANFVDDEEIQEIKSNIYYNINKYNFDAELLAENNEKWGQWIGFYSSGTMGYQKKFVYNADTMLNLLLVEQDKIENGDVKDILERNKPYIERNVLIVLPIYHILGFVFPISMLYFKCNIVYCDGTSMNDIVEISNEYKIFGAIGVPVLWELMINIANRRYKNSQNPIKELLGNQFQVIVSGGSKTKKEIRQYYFNHGIDFFVGYGMTELGFLSLTSKSVEDINSEGFLYHLYDCKVLNENGELSSSGEGELLVDTKGNRSYCLKDGKISELELFEGRYFKTGDIFCIKENKLHFKGRKKNIIVCSNGENIFAEDIENKLELISKMKLLYCIAEYNDMVSLYLSNANNEITQIELEKIIDHVKNVNKTLYISSKIKKMILINEKIDTNPKGKLLIYKLNENSDIKVVDIL